MKKHPHPSYGRQSREGMTGWRQVQIEMGQWVILYFGLQDKWNFLPSLLLNKLTNKRISLTYLIKYRVSFKSCLLPANKQEVLYFGIRITGLEES